MHSHERLLVIIIRAARCDNANEALMFCFLSFLSFLFSARSPRSLGRSPPNFGT